MHRAVRVLRIALPIAFVVFLLLIGFSYSSNRSRPKPVSEPVTSTIRNESPASVAYLFEDTQTVGGKILSKVRARRTMGFRSGWYTLEDVELTIFRDNGRTYQLRAPEAQFHIETKAAEVKKGVHLTSSTGINVRTQDMKFDGNRLANEIPVEFAAQKWTGRAGGMDLNLQHESLRLIGGVQATTVSARQNEPPIQITSKTAEFLQSRHEVTFHQDVVLVRAGDTLKNQNVTARFDPERDVLTGLEGCCAVEMRLRGGSPLLPSEVGAGEAQIEAERFSTEIGPQGEIRAIIALGAPTRSRFEGPPRRDVTSALLRIAFDGQQLSEIRAEGAVDLKEQVRPAVRRMQASFVTLYVQPDTRKVSSIAAQEKIRYDDGQNQATSERANYDALNELLVLSAHIGVTPTLTSEGHRLRGNVLEVSQKDRVLRGRGAVAAQLASSDKKGIGADETALFPRSDGPVFVNSEAVVMRQADRVAVFSDNVRAWQGANVLFAKTLQLEAAGEALNARENVRVIMYNVRGEKRTKPMTTRSDVLIAKKADRNVLLEGKVTIEDEPRTLSADRATIFLDSSRRIDRVEAHSNVVVAEKTTGRRATGTHALYKLTEKTLKLDGTPAVVSEPRGTVKGNQIVFDIARNQVNVLSPETTEATYHPE